MNGRERMTEKKLIEILLCLKSNKRNCSKCLKRGDRITKALCHSCYTNQEKYNGRKRRYETSSKGQKKRRNFRIRQGANNLS
jgi:hypothetical protein